MYACIYVRMYVCTHVCVCDVCVCVCVCDVCVCVCVCVCASSYTMCLTISCAPSRHVHSRDRHMFIQVYVHACVIMPSHTFHRSHHRTSSKPRVHATVMHMAYECVSNKANSWPNFVPPFALMAAPEAADGTRDWRVD
jgi:hypothetical protein